MTPDELRTICDSLNDERRTSGRTRLAELLGCHVSTVRRKLAGKTAISRADELAIERAMQKNMEDTK